MSVKIVQSIHNKGVTTSWILQQWNAKLKNIFERKYEIKWIEEAASPENLTQVSCVGLLKYFGRFNMLLVQVESSSTSSEHETTSDLETKRLALILIIIVYINIIW